MENKLIEDLVNDEHIRQNQEICLIASENIVSPEILKLQGSIFTNKYAEGYPNNRYYRGCKVVDKIENTAIEYAKLLFSSKYANVQPHSGSQANQAVYLALMKPGDTLLGMDLNAGGHLTHGSKVSASGKIYNSVTYGLDENGYLNYEEIENKLKENCPRILVVGASAYSRLIDYKRIKEIVDRHNENVEKGLIESFNNYKNIASISKDEAIESAKKHFLENDKCYLMVDMAHIAGLVAAKLIPNPLLYADVVTSTTHKTLRGPRGGLILTNDEELAKKIDKAVFPGIQGGPLMHVIAAKAQCFYEALDPEFKIYQEQVLKNAKAFEKVFKEKGIKMVSGGTDNHLLLLDLTDCYINAGSIVEQSLENIGIIVNRNAIPNDSQPKSITSGIRIGTPNITTRGFTENDCDLIARIISIIVNTKELDSEMLDILRTAVHGLASKHPIYK